jgi:Zn-dependent M28 family amino/carboxypeptidase
VESDAFEFPSPNGVVRGVNLIARFSAEGFRPVPRTPRAVLIVAPYDTRAFSTIHFVGANDGASGPAMLLELARVLSLNPKLAERVELLFADASEPRQQFSPTDGLAGSRHYVARVDLKSLRRVLVLGGVGANGEALTVPPDTPAEVWQEATQGCARIGKPALLRKLDRFMWGDHVPFAERGVSNLYLGNHDYLARYTTDDRIEKLSATTLEQGGQFATWLVSHWAQP